MLISFSVQNFRSYASRQTISLVAGAGAKREGQFSFPSGNALAPHVLRAACLFGPNGAGKTSLVQAFDFFKSFVVSSAKDKQEGEKIDVVPFKLDEKWRAQPTEFEITFIHRDVLYQYGFAVDKERVWSEWLFSTPNAAGKVTRTRSRTLFQREYDKKKKAYAWDISKTYVQGQKELWKRTTRDNALFLSTAIQLKAEVFKESFDWIQNHLRVVDSPERLLPSFSIRQCDEEMGWKDEILSFLQAADIRVKDLNIDVRDFSHSDLPKDLPGPIRDEFKKKMMGGKVSHVYFSHEGANGELVPLELGEESDGTQVIFSIAGPWLDVLKNGYTLVIDELHNSLHPHALRFLVKLFLDPDINTTNAQLIFTSHETSVMAKGLMHQDQVWLVEKDDKGSSKLVPLSDFKVRNVSAFQKAYLDGRYGAVPRLREFLDVQS